MSAEDLKNKKPKYPQTTTGTHCMGDGWTICCPNKHLKYDRYIPTKQVINVYYRGGIYRVFICTSECLRVVKNMSNKNPELFKKTFIHSVKPNGDLVLKHRDTGVIAQIAKKIDTYTETKSAKKGKKSTRKQKGGHCSSSARRSHGRRHHRHHRHSTMKHRK